LPGEKSTQYSLPCKPKVGNTQFLRELGPKYNLSVSSSSNATLAFRAARDFLLAHRDDYATAYAGFQWPELDRFNWALDWFDQIAAGERRNQIALWVAYEDGRQDKLTFTELSQLRTAEAERAQSAQRQEEFREEDFPELK
jgi:acetyl-CoA synthetase